MHRTMLTYCINRDTPQSIHYNVQMHFCMKSQPYPHNQHQCKAHEKNKHITLYVTVTATGQKLTLVCDHSHRFQPDA